MLVHAGDTVFTTAGGLPIGDAAPSLTPWFVTTGLWRGERAGLLAGEFSIVGSTVIVQVVILIAVVVFPTAGWCVIPQLAGVHLTQPAGFIQYTTLPAIGDGRVRLALP